MKKRISVKLISGLLVLSLLAPCTVWASAGDQEQEAEQIWTDRQPEQEEETQDTKEEITPGEDSPEGENELPEEDDSGDVTLEDPDPDSDDSEADAGIPDAEATKEPQPSKILPEAAESETARAATAAGQWKSENGKLWYRNADGSYTRSDFQKIDGKWFYFDKDGWLLTGWQKIGGRWYYFNKTGAAGTKGYLLTGWQTIDGKLYYLKQSGDKGVIGRMFTGWQTINKQTFYFDSSGAMLTGLQKIGKKSFYFQKTGNPGDKGRILTGWRTFGTTTYYFKQTGDKGVRGQMFTGMQNIGGRTYYFASSGILQTGWHQIGSKWFYFQKSGTAGTLGRMLTGWLKNGGKIYYLKASGEKGEKGRMFTGWQTIGSYTYYFNSSGALQTGWQKIGAQTFYFKASGDYGVRGRMFTGWVTIGGNKYFFKRTGAFGVKGARFYGGYKSIDGKKYFFDSNGICRKITGDYAQATDPINKKTYTVETEYYTDPQIGNGSNQVTQTEFLAAVLYTEAGNQGLEGQIMVALAIYNRMLSSSFPSSMNIVVYAKNQFEVARNGRLTSLLEGIRDDDQTALNKIKGNSLNAAKKATTSTGAVGTKGRMLTGWREFGGKTFYLMKTGQKGVKGKMLTGWQSIGGRKYYFKASGASGVKGQRFEGGWKRIAGQEYLFDTDGVLQSRTMTNEEFVAYIGPIAHEDMKKTGILASVTTAQAILESGYGSTELAVQANNLFGMKASLSGNTWSSDWGGQTYDKKTIEYDEDGNMYTEVATFRRYGTHAASVKDHSDYLAGAKNGTQLRYKGVVGNKSYKKTVELIKKGGYATDPKYVDKLCDIIERWNLTQYD